MCFVSCIRCTAVVYKAWFIAFFWIGIVKANPCDVILAPSQQRDVSSETLDFCLEDRKLWHKKLLHGMRPFINDRIYASEFCEKYFLECGTSISAAGFVTVPPGEISGNASKYKGNGDLIKVSEKIFDHWPFVWILIGLFPLFFYRDPWGGAGNPYMKHNVELTGPQNAKRFVGPG